MGPVDQLGLDVRDAVRALTHRPGFTTIAVLSLAIGIGANTAIFSLVNAVMLRPTPIERPEAMVNLYMHQTTFRFSTLSYPDFEDVRENERGLQSPRCRAVRAGPGRR